MNQLIRSFPAVVDDVDAEKRTVVAKVSVGDVDRHRSVITSGGISLAHFRQNPVVLFEHGKDPNRGALPVGKCEWIREDTVGNGRILAKTRFAKDSFSSMLLDFYRDGTMRGWSIMILPREASPPTREEIRSRPELADCEIMYRASDLGEYSAVSVPSCASALSEPELRSLSKLVVRGFWTPSEEVAPLVERMCEADEAVDEQDVAEETPATDVDPIPELTRDASEVDAVDRALDTKPVVEITPAVAEAETEAEIAVEELVADVTDYIVAVVAADPEPEPAVPDPIPEPVAPPEPVLPPLVGRSFESIVAEIAGDIKAFHKSNLDEIRDFAGWLRGEA